MSPPDADDDTLAGLWCARLELGSPTQVRRLRGGRSGSLVLGLVADGTPLVVKVTADPDRLARARLEVELLRSASLGDLAPEMLASATGPDWVAIASRAGTPMGSPVEVDRATWVELATRLARLHDRAVEAYGVPVPPAAEPDLGVDALRPWAELGAEQAAARGVRRLADVVSSPLPVGLEHGDCHLDNILRDADGSLVWIDWQEVRAGDGLADLVFLWQRAEFSGGRPPRAEMTAAYGRTRRLDPGLLPPLIDQAELRLLLGSWPPFLAYGSDEAREVMRRRLEALVGEV